MALGVLLVALRAAQVGLIRVPLGPWPQLVAKVPTLARLAVALLVITHLARRIMTVVRYRTNTFRPILLLTVVSLIILYLLHPNLSPEDGEGGS